MKNRCKNPSNSEYHRYGGRGIRVCDRWLNSFETFLSDMGEPPLGHSIDRINNNGDYEPGNCRWADRRTQQNNRSTNIVVSFNGKTQTLAQWADELGVKLNTLLCRLRRGWSPEKTLCVPIGRWQGGLSARKANASH